MDIIWIILVTIQLPFTIIGLWLIGCIVYEWYEPKFFYKLKCKKNGHRFEYSHKESSGFGNIWHWKKCTICDYSTFDNYSY